MQIETGVPIPTTLNRQTKYAELWTALRETAGTSAVTVMDLTLGEVQKIRVAARINRAFGQTWKLRSIFKGGVFTCWIVPRVQVPPISRTLVPTPMHTHVTS